jgi:alkylation response protein AidB-like acyl-CoA dehydrogenase
VVRHDLGGEQLRLRLPRLQRGGALVPVGDCTVLDTWDPTGLRATGSHDYVIDDVFVTDEDSYDPTAPPPRDEPLYRFPPLFLASHCGVPLGIARRAIDAVIDLGEGKAVSSSSFSAPSNLRDTVQAQEAVSLAEAQLGGARSLCFSAVGELWEAVVAARRVTRRQRAMYRVAMSWTHQISKDVVSLMYDTASTSSIPRGSTLDRQLRDITTACQHRVVHPRVYAPAGRLFFGMESGDPMI